MLPTALKFLTKSFCWSTFQLFIGVSMSFYSIIICFLKYIFRVLNEASLRVFSLFQRIYLYFRCSGLLYSVPVVFLRAIGHLNYNRFVTKKKE